MHQRNRNDILGRKHKGNRLPGNKIQMGDNIKVVLGEVLWVKFWGENFDKRRKTLRMGWRTWYNEIHNEDVSLEIGRETKTETGGTVNRRVGNETTFLWENNARIVRSRSEGTINTDQTEIGCEWTDSITLVWDRVQWRVSENTVTNPRAPYRDGTSWLSVFQERPFIPRNDLGRTVSETVSWYGESVEAAFRFVYDLFHDAVSTWGDKIE
jgi:hypothetical protein